VATDRLQAGEKMRVYNTLTRIEADITSLLGMNITTELCHQKCRRTQARSHNWAGIVIYIMGVGVERRQSVGQCRCYKHLSLQLNYQPDYRPNYQLRADYQLKYQPVRTEVSA